MGGGFVEWLAPEVLAGGFGTLVTYGSVGLAFAGLALGILGAVGLLHRRLTDPSLRDFSAPADFFNLLFFVAAFGVALAHLVLVDRDLSRSQAFVSHLVTFHLAALAGGDDLGMLTLATVVLLGALVAYIPLTHMSHFIGKYFAYHAIRWNDTPNLRGGRQEPKIQQVLNYPVSWAAPHIGGDGKKTWAEVATEENKR
jgi:nitrate reductase gamma subunit